MSYIESNLGKDEVILMQAAFHNIMVISWIVIGAIGIVSIVVPLISIFMIISFRGWELCYTNKKVIGKTGYVISARRLDLPLNKITAVSLEQGIIGKIFGYGTVVVTAGIDRNNFSFVKNPEVFRRSIMEQIEIFDQERIKQQATEMAAAMHK